MGNIPLANRRLSLLILFLFLSLALLQGCALTGSYMFSLKFACVYDSRAGVFLNASQNFDYSDKTFISIDNNKPVYKKGTVKEYSIPAQYTASGSEVKFKAGYIIENGKLCVAPPILEDATFTAAYVLPGEESAVFLFNYAEPLIINFTEDTVAPVFDRDADRRAPAEIISVSPDGKYILYKSDGELFAKNLISGEESLVMDFNRREFISWNKEEDGSFLYREDRNVIHSYSLGTNAVKVFRNDYKLHEIIDDTYLYTYSERTLSIANYYTGDLISTDTGGYSAISGVKVSPDGEYAVMYGMHTNIDGKLITEVISIHLGSGRIVAHTEEGDGVYIVDSYQFGSRSGDGANVLIINYLNTGNLSRKAEFYVINYK